MRTIDLEALSIFRAVVEEGGVVRAAAKLNRVPSNVTTRIRHLEEQLGVRLFRRQGRTLDLSAEGRTLLSYAVRLLRLADEATNDIVNGRPRGVFRIGSLESAAGSRLPPLLSAYHARFPDIVVELVTGNTGALLKRVASFEIEAAFVAEPFSAPQLQSTPVFDEHLVLITPGTSKRIRTPTDLGKSTLIAFAHGCSYRKRIEAWLAGAGIAPERVLEFESYQAIIACVAAGTGFAVVPRSLLQSLTAAKAVHQHALPKSYARTRTHIAWRGDPSPALTALIGLLAENERGAASAVA